MLHFSMMFCIVALLSLLDSGSSYGGSETSTELQPRYREHSDYILDLTPLSKSDDDSSFDVNNTFLAFGNMTSLFTNQSLDMSSLNKTRSSRCGGGTGPWHHYMKSVSI